MSDDRDDEITQLLNEGDQPDSVTDEGDEKEERPAKQKDRAFPDASQCSSRFVRPSSR
jgi:hypothetical protein